MPIRTIPFQQIQASHVEELQRREIREDRTLDYKEKMPLENRDDKHELLKDTTALANASGGTLLYGVAEGDGDERGLIKALPGLTINVDAAHGVIENLLRDSVDERIMGVLHRAIPNGEGRPFYVIRVPPSPLAPHMVTIGQPRFYLRGNTASDPMNARQIKEVALRASTAEDRALAVAAQRRDILKDRATKRRNLNGTPNPDKDHIALHTVPFFPRPGGWELADKETAARLIQVSAFGYRQQHSDPRYAQDGMYVEHSRRYVAFLRSGAVEFHQYDILAREREGSPRVFRSWWLEQEVIEALDECAGLTGDGLLPLPALVSLTLSGVSSSVILRHPRHWGPTERPLEEDTIVTTPFFIHEWGADAERQLRRAFDEIQQAYGLARCELYAQNGQRLWFRNEQQVTTPALRFWNAGAWPIAAP